MILNVPTWKWNFKHCYPPNVFGFLWVIPYLTSCELNNLSVFQSRKPALIYGKWHFTWCLWQKSTFNYLKGFILCLLIAVKDAKKVHKIIIPQWGTNNILTIIPTQDALDTSTVRGRKFNSKFWQLALVNANKPCLSNTKALASLWVMRNPAQVWFYIKSSLVDTWKTTPELFEMFPAVLQSISSVKIITFCTEALARDLEGLLSLQYQLEYLLLKKQPTGAKCILFTGLPKRQTLNHHSYLIWLKQSETEFFIIMYDTNKECPSCIGLLFNPEAVSIPN